MPIAPKMLKQPAATQFAGPTKKRNNESKLTMNFKLALIGAVTLTLLVAGNPARGQPLPNNFWQNSSFGSGTNLNAPDGSGTPTGWVRNGSDPTIDQVTPVSLPDSSYAIMVNDQDTGNYGEWDSYISLAGLVNAGDTINVQYDQMYSTQDGQMRVTVGFLDVNNNFITADNFLVSGDSPGWNGDIASSTFTQTNQSVLVPIGAVTLNVAVVSDVITSGYLVVDDLYVARAPTPDLLPGNFWPNPSFELGSNLDQTNGVPTGWNSYNSGSSIITQVTTNNYVSASHALAVVDGDPTAYGSWYSDHAPLTNTAIAGSILNLQWFELYSITNGDFRVVFTFFDGGGNSLGGDHNFVVNGNSAGWQGAVAGSGFTQVNQQLTVPAGAVTIGVQLVSAGSGAETGIMMIDDLSIALQPPPPPLLPGNFWPNPGFELGSNLDQTNGVPTGWNSYNSGSSIITQVSTNNYVSPTHSLALVDNDPLSYGSWYSNHAPLTNTAIAGSTLDLQWYELYSITNGDFRVVFTFFDGGGNGLGDNNFVVNGNSAGWQGTVAGSGFTQVNQQLTVPVGAVTIAVQLISAGSGAETGIMLIDNLSVAVHVVQPLPPTVLAGNFFPNPTFEVGVLLDNPTLGIPAGGWNRGGSSSLIDQITTNNSTSPTHSLELLDNDTGNYGEWYMFFNLSGLVSDNDAVDIQWFQLYSITNGQMRLSFAFLDTNSVTLFNIDNNTSPNGTNAGWQGSVGPPSTFDQEFIRLAVPVGTTQLRVNFASGGASSVTGVMLIDDLSVRLSVPNFTAVAPQSGGYNLTWNSMASKNYTVQFTGSLSPTPTWTPLATNIPGGFPTTSYLDTASHGGHQGFYRILQQ
jgi:hypothetical protein